jgi:hypothetical protein
MLALTPHESVLCGAVTHTARVDRVRLDSLDDRDQRWLLLLSEKCVQVELLSNHHSTRCTSWSLPQPSSAALRRRRWRHLTAAERGPRPMTP